MKTRFALALALLAQAGPAAADAPVTIAVRGSVGYYCAGMNKFARVTVHGNAGPGVAENMMSGVVWVKGNGSESAGATGNGGEGEDSGNELGFHGADPARRSIRATRERSARAWIASIRAARRLRWVSR